MFDNSAQDLYDIGQKTGCEKVNKASGNAGFLILNLQMSTVPSQTQMGFCIPK